MPDVHQPKSGQMQQARAEPYRTVLLLYGSTRDTVYEAKRTSQGSTMVGLQLDGPDIIIWPKFWTLPGVPYHTSYHVLAGPGAVRSTLRSVTHALSRGRGSTVPYGR